MALDIDVSEVGQGGRRVALRGRLDTLTAPVLDERLAPLLASASVTALLFDLAGLDYVSSAGLRVLVKTRRALESSSTAIASADRSTPSVSTIRWAASTIGFAICPST